MLGKAHDGDEKMIVADLEFSGLDPVRCGIWQIGAIDLENSNNKFFDESRIDDDDIITEEALKIIGKTEAELRDKSKQSQKQLLEKFFKWCEKTRMKNFVFLGPQWDMAFLWIKSLKYCLEFPADHRAFDLHSIACLKYFQVKHKILLSKGHSDMNLEKISKFCGVKMDQRIQIEGDVIKGGKPHNAFEDAKITAECFSRIFYGKNLLDEYVKFPVPDYLKK